MKHTFNSSINKALKMSVCALAVLAATSSPAMAESVELSVKGTIIPAACTPSIIGEVNYDNITADKLSDKDFYVLGEKEVDFTIVCDAPVKVGIKPLNLKPGSVAGSEEKGDNNVATSPVPLLGVANINVAGLGTTTDGKNIGGYAVGILNDTLEADGDKLFMKLRGGADTWFDYSTGDVSSLYYMNSPPGGVLTFSWGDDAAVQTPTAITRLSARLVVDAYLNKTTELDTGSAIQLNGLTTIELVYL